MGKKPIPAQKEALKYIPFKNRNEDLVIQPSPQPSQSHEHLSQIQIQGMTELGLDRHQVKTFYFSQYTINAIKKALGKGINLQAAFEQYKELSEVQIQGMIELGLDRSQVLSNHFSQYTFNAVKKGLEKGLDLQVAFEQYKELSEAQIRGMIELDLNRSQVQSANFGHHIINAIIEIRKQNKKLSLITAFELVLMKNYSETINFLKSYLNSEKKFQSICDMQCIRVIVNTGRGFGHQRAAITLMEKLREIGFSGFFDIHCDDRYDAQLCDTNTGKFYINKTFIVSSALINMIPGFENAPLSKEGIKTVPGLGALKLSSLPHPYRTSKNLDLSPVDLAVSAADDLPSSAEKKALLFNATAFIGLEPTDWHQGGCYVVEQDQNLVKLPFMTMRLSSNCSYTQPEISTIALSDLEKRILTITTNKNFNTQLVYGLYPEFIFDRSGRLTPNGNLDEKTEMQLIIEANLSLSIKVGKPTILLLPQKIALAQDFQQALTGKNIKFIDLTQNSVNMEDYSGAQVIIAYTGQLQYRFFDYLLLKGTTLPPIIEGCNARELCEIFGRAFIHGSSKLDKFRQYKVKLENMQKLHTEASLCLQLGEHQYCPALLEYLERSLNCDAELLAYQKQRQEQFTARPDACELAFNTLRIHYSTEPSKKLKLTHADLSENEEKRSSLFESSHAFFPTEPIPSPKTYPIVLYRNTSSFKLIAEYLKTLVFLYNYIKNNPEALTSASPSFKLNLGSFNTLRPN